MSKYYRVANIGDETVTLCDVTEGTEKVCDFAELNTITQSNVVVGYNKITGGLKVTTLRDFALYMVNKSKLSSTNPRLVYDADKDMVITKADFRYENNALIITVDDLNNFPTEGICLIDWGLLPIEFKDYDIKSCIYDIPTSNYKYVEETENLYGEDLYGDTNRRYSEEVFKVSFTDRCTFKGVENITNIMSRLPRDFKLLIDMHNLNFENMTRVDSIMSNSIRAYDSDIILPDNLKSVDEGVSILQSGWIGYEATKFIDSFDTISDMKLEELRVDSEKVEEHFELIESVFERCDIPLSSLVLPLNRKLLIDIYNKLYLITEALDCLGLNYYSDSNLSFDFTKKNYDTVSDLLDKSQIKLSGVYSMGSYSDIHTTPYITNDLDIKPCMGIFDNFINKFISIFDDTTASTISIICDTDTYEYGLVLLEILAYQGYCGDRITLSVGDYKVNFDEVKERIIQLGGTLEGEL